MIISQFFSPRTAGLIGLLLLAACEQKALPPTAPDADAAGHIAPTEYTRRANQAVADAIAGIASDDWEAANRGLIARETSLVIPGPQGRAVWNRDAYDFIEGEAPDSVNPSLWRQAGLNNIHGLFEVTPGIYQIRGYDLANLSLIEGETGWILVDPLTSAETASAALAFAFEHLPKKPISAVIFTHSHIDHFAGILGVVEPERLASGEVMLVAPDGFMEEATSENILAGQVMKRRADFMYGRYLARSERGHVGSGLGKEPAIGTVAIAEPTYRVIGQSETMTIDGVAFEFRNVPGSEAPSEFVFYLPEKKALCGAELVSRNMHNLYTLRGAKVRDALKWSGYIDDTRRWFPDAEIVFNSHHWPVWGKTQVDDYLKQQRDIYKYIHDQTVRLASQGHTLSEVADAISLPKDLQVAFHNRGYYGTLRHNARAVYQFYFGWYDGNPANLNPLSPEASAPRYVELMGGIDSVLAAAQAAYDRGEYRWVVELLQHVIFSDPNVTEARSLLAAAYDQLGYQAESGPWRDVYLSGARELRFGPPEGGETNDLVLGLLRETPIPRVLELVSAMVNGPEADGESLLLNFNITDRDENYVLRLENAVLHHELAPIDEGATVTLNLSHDMLLRILTKQVGVTDLFDGEDLSIEGSKLDLVAFLGVLQAPMDDFNIIEP